MNSVYVSIWFDFGPKSSSSSFHFHFIFFFVGCENYILFFSLLYVSKFVLIFINNIVRFNQKRVEPKNTHTHTHYLHHSHWSSSSLQLKLHVKLLCVCVIPIFMIKLNLSLLRYVIYMCSMCVCVENEINFFFSNSSFFFPLLSSLIYSN